MADALAASAPARSFFVSGSITTRLWLARCEPAAMLSLSTKGFLLLLRCGFLKFWALAEFWAFNYKEKGPGSAARALVEAPSNRPTPPKLFFA